MDDFFATGPVKETHTKLVAVTVGSNWAPVLHILHVDIIYIYIYIEREREIMSIYVNMHSIY